MVWHVHAGDATKRASKRTLADNLQRMLSLRELRGIEPVDEIVQVAARVQIRVHACKYKAQPGIVHRATAERLVR